MLISSWESLVALRSWLSLAVKLGGNGMEDLLELLSLLFELALGGVLVSGHPLVKFLAFVENTLSLLLGDLLLDFVVLNLVLGLVDELLEVVSGLDLVLSLLVGLFVSLGFLDQSLDLLLGKSSLLVGDLDVGGLTGSLVLGSDCENSVGIQVKRDLDLRDSSWSWRNTR